MFPACICVASISESSKKCLFLPYSNAFIEVKCKSTNHNIVCWKEKFLFEQVEIFTANEALVSHFFMIHLNHLYKQCFNRLVK